MRSPATLNEALARGLRRDSNITTGLAALQAYSGLRPTDYGAKRFQTITQPFGTTDALSNTYLGTLGTKTWPFPQMFRGRNTTVLAFDDGIFRAIPSGLYAWTASEYTLKSAEDYLAESPGSETLDAAGPWQFVDFWSFWMLFGLDWVCWKSPHSDYVWASDDVTVRTGCNFKDARLFLGGFDQSNMYDLVDWPTYFASLFGDSSHLVQTAMANLGQGAAGN